MKQFVFLFCLAVLLFSCTRNSLKINVSNVTLELKIKHLDVDLLKLNQAEMPSAIAQLKASYKGFFDIFTYKMIAIGGTEQENFPQLLFSFVSDTLIRSLQTTVTQKIDTLQLRKKLEIAFRHYKYYFPQKKIPVIYTCISGFNQSVVTADQVLGVSLDKYLGVESRFYPRLGLQEYKIRNMHPQKIVPDMMAAWATTEWPMEDHGNSLLSQMIQQGKVMYFVDAMLPDLDDSLKIGFTAKQLEFCKKSEASMWAFLAEHKLLFSTDRMNIKRFMDDGPYTSAFTDKSPARTGTWIGWQIVRSYMRQHKEIKLADLMEMTDYQVILNQSGYQP